MDVAAAVRLEPLQAAHADGLFGPLSDPALYHYLDDEPPASVEWLRERFAALARGAPAGLEELWLNWIIQVDGRPVGTTQATIRTGAPSSVAYVVAVPAQGRGVGRVAVGLMLDRLAADHGVVDVQAEIDPANTASIGLAESLGFVAAGTIGTDRRFVRRLPR